MLVMIPSRARYDKLLTLDWLSEKVRKKTYLVVYPDEAYAYHRCHCNVLVVPPEVQGINLKRQYMVEWAAGNGHDKLLMLDDDLNWAQRRQDEPSRFEQTSPEGVEWAINQVDWLLNTYAMAHISHREGAHVRTDDYVYNSRAMRALGYRTDVLMDEMITFRRWEFISDFGVQLSLLSRGYATIGVNNVVHNQLGTGTPGGCSVYRTSSRQAASAAQLAADFPQFVRLVTKEGRNQDEPERTDVRIRWKEAFNSAGSLRTPKVLDRGEGSHPQPEGSEPPKAVDA